MTLEEQRLYTKGLEGDLQRANQPLLNTESIVKATRTANEAMQATVDYWSTFYEDENAAAPSANPTATSSNMMGNTAQLPEIPQTVAGASLDARTLLLRSQLSTWSLFV